MSGRIYRLRRVCGNRACGNRVNRFAWKMYNQVAAAMGTVDRDGKKVEVKFRDPDMISNGSSIISDVLRQVGNRGGTPLSFSSENKKKKIIFTFNDRKQADWAYQNVLNVMIGDKIVDNPNITSDGGLRTNKGLYIRVDYEAPENPGDAPKPSDEELDRPGSGDYESGGGDTRTYGGTGTGSSWTTWALIGGGVLLIVIVVAMFLKKKK